MDETHRQKLRVRFLVSLLVFCVESVSVLPGNGVADEGTGPLDVRADKGDGTEEGTALQGEALKLEAVLAYAHEHNPAIRAARSRLRAAQKVPAQASAYEDPLVMWDNWNSPENLHLNEASNNIFRLSQKIPFPGKLRLKGEIAAKDTRVIRRAKEAINRIDVMDVHTSYRIEQGFTFELNLAGVADEHRDEFVATGKPRANK